MTHSPKTHSPNTPRYTLQTLDERAEESASKVRDTLRHAAEMQLARTRANKNPDAEFALSAKALMAKWSGNR